ncbi:hypothetical protein ACOQFS_11335, partial [Paracidovorax sp. MALMAid1276]
MSYILDALRRAEAERGRGGVPGLHTQATPLPGALPADARAAPSRLIAVAAAVLGVAALAAVGTWWALQRSAPAGGVVLAGASPAPTPAAAPAAAPAVPPASASAALAPLAPAAPTAPAVSAAPAPAPAPAPPPRATEPRPAPAAVREKPPVPAARAPSPEAPRARAA